MRAIRTFLRHARRDVVAYLALFVALGGTSYAAIKLPAGSVGSKQLRKGAVTTSKISKKTRTALRGARGRTGRTGAVGRPGGTGPSGPAGPTASGSGSTPGTVALSAAPATVVDLGTAGAEDSGPVRTSFPARLVISASLRMFKTTSDWNKAGKSLCQVEVGSGGSYAIVGNLAESTFEKSLDLNAVVARQVPLVAAVTRPPGTYDVRVRCTAANNPGPPAFDATLGVTSADLAVVAVRAG
jgi:hypothetical protein